MRLAARDGIGSREVWSIRPTPKQKKQHVSERFATETSGAPAQPRKKGANRQFPGKLSMLWFKAQGPSTLAHLPEKERSQAKGTSARRE